MDQANSATIPVMEETEAETGFDVHPIGERSAFAPIENAVIHLSGTDPLSSIVPSWRDVIGRWIGAPQVNRLSNPRLEALRRFAIIARVCIRPSRSDFVAFFRAGFSPAQARVVRARTRARTAATQLGLSNGLIYSALLTLALVTYVIVDREINEPLLAIIAAGVVCSTLSSIASPRRTHR